MCAGIASDLAGGVNIEDSLELLEVLGLEGAPKLLRGRGDGCAEVPVHGVYGTTIFLPSAMRRSHSSRRPVRAAFSCSVFSTPPRKYGCTSTVTIRSPSAIWC